MKNNWKIETQAVQGAYEAGNAEARVLPLYQSTTYRYDTCEELASVFDLEQDTPMYTRLANPTTDAFEKKIAMMEGGVYAVYHCLRIMQENHLEIKSPILVSEGGSKSALWRQIASDIMNVELSYMKEAKGAPMGNVINAGVASGIFKSFDVAKDFIHVEQIHYPDLERHAVYEKYYALYRKLYEDIKENYDILSRIKNG